ncbi:MAG: hypothetical protein EBS83_10710 [Planctomycetia bacterium]|nr:hypothetical protein [Planctomycetia bacterium]
MLVVEKRGDRHHVDSIGRSSVRPGINDDSATNLATTFAQLLLCNAAGVPTDSDGARQARPRLGAVSFQHRFGSALNQHVHPHACVADGVFAQRPAGGGVTFHAARPLTASDLATAPNGYAAGWCGGFVGRVFSAGRTPLPCSAGSTMDSLSMPAFESHLLTGTSRGTSGAWSTCCVSAACQRLRFSGFRSSRGE